MGIPAARMVVSHTSCSHIYLQATTNTRNFCGVSRGKVRGLERSVQSPLQRRVNVIHRNFPNALYFHPKRYSSSTIELIHNLAQIVKTHGWAGGIAISAVSILGAATIVSPLFIPWSELRIFFKERREAKRLEKELDLARVQHEQSEAYRNLQTVKLLAEEIHKLRGILGGPGFEERVQNLLKHSEEMYKNHLEEKKAQAKKECNEVFEVERKKMKELEVARGILQETLQTFKENKDPEFLKDLQILLLERDKIVFPSGTVYHHIFPSNFVPIFKKVVQSNLHEATKVDLEGTYIKKNKNATSQKNDGIQLLMEGLTTNTKILELNLKNTGVTSEDLAKIIEMLAVNQTLEVLNLSNNELKGSEAEVLYFALARNENRALKRLILRDAKMSKTEDLKKKFESIGVAVEF